MLTLTPGTRLGPYELVAPNGQFLLLVPSGGNTAPPIDVVVNWPRLLKK